MLQNPLSSLVLAGAPARMHRIACYKLQRGLTLVGWRVCPVVCGDVGARPQVLHEQSERVSGTRPADRARHYGESAQHRAFLCRAASPRPCCAFAKFDGQWHGRLKRSSILWARLLPLAHVSSGKHCNLVLYTVVSQAEWLRLREGCRAGQTQRIEGRALVHSPACAGLAGESLRSQLLGNRV